MAMVRIVAIGGHVVRVVVEGVHSVGGDVEFLVEDLERE